MCAAMVERDPGLNRFNDDHYYNQGGQQNMSYNQDYQQGLQIGNYKDRRRVLDYERHKEYNILLREKKDQEARRLDELYGRRTHVPEKPELFDYKKQQQHNYEEKKKEYQEFLKKKEAESHMKKPPSPPSVGLDIGKHDMMRKQRQQAMQELYKSQLDEQKQEQLFHRIQELQKDYSPVFLGYNDYERPLVGAHKDYEIRQAMLAEERHKDYNDMIKQKNQEIRNAQKRSPTPPVGLNILTQEERRRRDEARKKIYREELLMQQKEQMLSKAQHEIEVPRFNASPQKTSSQPLESSRPPPQDYDRMPPQEYNRRSRDGPMSSMEQQISNDHAYEDRKQQLMREIGADKEARDRQYREMIDRDRDARDIHAQEFHRHDEQLRDKNIMEYLEKKRIEEERQFNHPRKKKLGSDSYGQMDESYDPGRYEEMRHRLQDETHQEYKKELAKGPRNDIKYGLPIGQWRYDQQIKQRQMERNKEYNEFLKAQPRLTYSAQPDTRIPIAKGFDFNVQKIIPTGDKIFEGIHKAIREDYLQDFRDYSQKAENTGYHYQNVKEKPKEFWKTDRLQIVPTSGEYSKRSQRFKEQLHRDFQEIQNQKEPPKPRNKDFGEKGQVLIRDPGKDFTSRHKQAEQEFKQSFQEYMAEKKKNPENPKRNLNKRPDSGKDPAKNPSKQIGYMAYPGAREHDRKREERPRDYNGYAPEQPSWYNQEVAPVGLATPNKDEYRQPRERLGSYNHGDYVRDSPTYQEMLESKRRHEAAYRRYDEPGLSHYPQTGQSDPADRYSPRRF